MYYEFVVLLFLFIVAMSPNCRVISYEINSFTEKDLEEYMEYTGSSGIDPNDPTQVATIIFYEAERPNEMTLYFFRRQNYTLRAKVNEEYKTLNGGVWKSMIPDDHCPFVESTLKDVNFALLHGPLETKQRYAKVLVCSPNNYEWGKILMNILIVEDTNRAHFIEELKKVPPTPNRPFDECLSENYVDDYKHFLSELSKKNRDTKIDQPHDEEVKNAVDKLNKERKGSSAVSKGWKFKRSVLDDYLMSKPTKLVQDILTLYAEKNSENKLRDDIKKKIDEENVIYGYQSLIDFNQNPEKYIAIRIHETVRGEYDDRRATLILFGIGTSETPELGKIAEAFYNKYKISLKSFLEKKCMNDVVCDTVRMLLP